jgi:hypothetical protein
MEETMSSTWPRVRGVAGRFLSSGSMASVQLCRDGDEAPGMSRRRLPLTAPAILVGVLALVSACTIAPPPPSEPVPPPPAPAPSPPPTTAPPVTGLVPLRDHVAFGAYVPDLPGGRTGLPALEAKLGTSLELASAFTDWSYVFGGANDHWMAAGGTRKVLYSWEPDGLRFTDISGGSQDGYLQQVADSMRRYPYDVHVRPWGEMNANWASWQPTPGGEKPNGGTPAEFIAAWRHVVSFFRDQGVHNLRFVFNTDASDFGDNTRVPAIWPGAAYVDVLGIDGYNWGRTPARGDIWREFDTIFTAMYGILTGLHPTAPVWITEVGAKEPSRDDGAPADPGRSKGAWFAGMMESTAFPRVEAIAWFSTNKERDWRIDSSDESLAGLKAQLALRT